LSDVNKGANLGRDRVGRGATRTKLKGEIGHRKWNQDYEVMEKRRGNDWRWNEGGNICAREGFIIPTPTVYCTTQVRGRGTNLASRKKEVDSS